MNDGLDKCKWCGEPEKNESLSSTRYLCNTQYFRLIGTWVRGGQCEREELRKRIAKAIEATQEASRFDLVAGRHGGIDAEPSSTGCYAWASVLDDIRTILQGNSPEIPEGST